MIYGFILTIGQETEEMAVKSLKNQVDKIEFIRNISPASRAENNCFDMAEKVNCDYFIVLGADTILYKNAIKSMLCLINDNVWSVMGRLEDFWRGTENYGNHLYNTKAINGYRFNEDDPWYDHKIHIDMIEKGFIKKITDKVIGKHHPIWTAREAFEKYLYNAKRYSEDQLKWLKESIDSKLGFDNDIIRAAKLGYEIGIKKRDPKVLDNKTTEEWEENKYLFNINEKLLW